MTYVNGSHYVDKGQCEVPLEFSHSFTVLFIYIYIFFQFIFSCFNFHAHLYPLSFLLTFWFIYFVHFFYHHPIFIHILPVYHVYFREYSFLSGPALLTPALHAPPRPSPSFRMPRPLPSPRCPSPIPMIGKEGPGREGGEGVGGRILVLEDREEGEKREWRERRSKEERRGRIEGVRGRGS